jgi:hypothetical protein
MKRKNTKIVELFLDDIDSDGAGLDFISIVTDPAIERNFLAFSDEKVLSDEHKEKIEKMLEDEIVGVSKKDALKNATIIAEKRVTNIKEEAAHMFNFMKVNDESITPDEFVKSSLITSNPDEPSALDFAGFKVRYYYEGPRDSKNRDWCRIMMDKDLLFRWEDINKMSQNVVNDEFGYYDIFRFKGSFVKLLYREDSAGNKYDPQIVDEPSEAGSVNKKPQRVPKENRQGFEEQYKVITEEFKTYNDYPRVAKEAARMAIERNRKLKNRCGTLTGKARAQQIANGRGLSLQTVKRVKSYLSRAKKNFDVAALRKDYDSCAYISYGLWAGESSEAMLKWADRTIRREENR